ncbi:Canalicular Multispecific Organic Anion Transporter 2 [Manis pentadactyla]|nr:Canalicular Multispecific Organic Anion Transporter 2 [Manis pentadactyla]
MPQPCTGEEDGEGRKPATSFSWQFSPRASFLWGEPSLSLPEAAGRFRTETFMLWTLQGGNHIFFHCGLWRHTALSPRGLNCNRRDYRRRMRYTEGQLNKEGIIMVINTIITAISTIITATAALTITTTAIVIATSSPSPHQQLYCHHHHYHHLNHITTSTTIPPPCCQCHHCSHYHHHRCHHHVTTITTITALGSQRAW